MVLGSIVATSGLTSVGAAIQATTSAKNATNAAIVVMSTSFPPSSTRFELRATRASPLHAVLPSCRLQLVRHLAMRRRVQTENFLLLRHAQANGDVDNLEDDPGHGSRERPHGHHGNRLLQQLPRVAVEETIGTGRVDAGRREQSGCQRAPDAAHAMDREDVERVVDPNVPLQDVDREEAEDARAETDQDRGRRVDETG